MIRATGAQFGKTGGIPGVHKAKDGFVFLNRSDETLMLAHLPAQPGENRGEGRVPLTFRQGLVFCSTEGFCVAALGLVFLFDVCGRLFNQLQRARVAHFLIVIP